MPPAPELRPAVAALLAEFLRHLALERGRSAHTVRAYRADLKPLLAGLDDIAALDLATLRRWLAAGHAAKASRSTLARRAAAARTFTALGPPHRAHGRPTRVCGWSHPGPGPRCRPCSPRSRPPPCSTPRAPGPRRATPLALRDLAVLELLYATGVRVAELCGLDLDDVDRSGARCGCSARAPGSARSSTARPPRRRWTAGWRQAVRDS